MATSCYFWETSKNGFVKREGKDGLLIHAPIFAVFSLFFLPLSIFYSFSPFFLSHFFFNFFYFLLLKLQQLFLVCCEHPFKAAHPSIGYPTTIITG